MSALALTASLIALASQCATATAPGTVLSFARAESRLDPLAVHSNAERRRYRPASRQEAVALAARLIAAGDRPDLGFMQINAVNLSWLGLSLDEAFDPCRSMQAGARVLHAVFDPCVDRGGEPQACLQTAASAYNTGSPARGFANGYVRIILAQAQHVIPEIRTAGVAPPLADPRTPNAPPPACADDDWHASAACSTPSDLDAGLEAPGPSATAAPSATVAPVPANDDALAPSPPVPPAVVVITETLTAPAIRMKDSLP